MKKGISDIIIIGAGLSGLATAHFLSKIAQDYRIIILEKSDRTGGSIQTVREKSYIMEAGPHGFLDNCEESLELLNSLNISTQIQKASLKKFIRYLCIKGQLSPIPQHPLKLIKSNILPIHLKLRVLGDLIKKPIKDQMSIANWVSHRFGKAILPFADAVITGTFAGDIEKLSMDAVYPGIRQLEREYGSIIKGLFYRKVKNSKKTGKGLPSMVNFDNGMSVLIDKIAEQKDIRLKQPVLCLKLTNDQWIIRTEKDIFHAKKVILATPVNPALKILNHLKTAPKLTVPTAKIVNVVLGFNRSDIDIPHGFGYLAPQREKRFALGALFSTHMFPKRAPKNHEMIEAMVGGSHHPDFLELTDEELIKNCYNDLKRLIKIKNTPRFTRVIRHWEGFPQLEMGHLVFQNYRADLEKQYRSLLITGFGWKGIGMNEMIKSAKDTAKKVICTDNNISNGANVKGIYF